MTSEVRPKVNARVVLKFFGRVLPPAFLLGLVIVAFLWNGTVSVTVADATPTSEPASSSTVTAVKTEESTLPSVTPTKIPATPTQAPTEPKVVETATEEPVQIPDPKYWVEFAHGSNASLIPYKVGDTCYGVPQGWVVSSTLNEEIGQCSKNDAIDLSKLEKLPETLAVTPRGSKPAHNFEETVGDGNESLDDALDGYSRVCSLSLVDGKVTNYRIGIMNEAFDAKPGETGQCYEVKAEGSNVHMLILRYIGQLNDVIDGGTHFYSVELPLEGNWLGNRPLVRLPE